MVAKVDIKFLNFFVLILGLRLQRYLTNTNREPPKKFLETLSLFFQPKFLEKGGGLLNLDWSQEVTGWLNTEHYYSVSPFSW